MDNMRLCDHCKTAKPVEDLEYVGTSEDPGRGPLPSDVPVEGQPQWVCSACLRQATESAYDRYAQGEATGWPWEQEPACDHEYEWSRDCGANVCVECGDHKGLARCYCGWSESGGNGYQELREMGETIEPDEW